MTGNWEKVELSSLWNLPTHMFIPDRTFIIFLQIFPTVRLFHTLEYLWFWHVVKVLSDGFTMNPG